MREQIRPKDYVEWKAAIGAAIKRQRDRSGRSLQATASRAEINPELLQSIEKGGGYLTLQQLYRLSRSLNIPISQLLLDTDLRPAAGDAREFINAFNRIKDPELKNRIHALVSTLVDNLSEEAPDH